LAGARLAQRGLELGQQLGLGLARPRGRMVLWALLWRLQATTVDGERMDLGECLLGGGRATAENSNPVARSK
jgi:hypothetical protein